MGMGKEKRDRVGWDGVGREEMGQERKRGKERRARVGGRGRSEEKGTSSTPPPTLAPSLPSSRCSLTSRRRRFAAPSACWRKYRERRMRRCAQPCPHHPKPSHPRRRRARALRPAAPFEKGGREGGREAWREGGRVRKRFGGLEGKLVGGRE